jgi:hypothetical protein
VIALGLPATPQLLGRRQVHTHVEQRAQLVGVVAEQPLDDDERLGRDVLRTAERPVFVAVDRLENRLAVAQLADVLRHDVEVVGVGMQGRDPELGALAAVVLVVVRHRDAGDVVPPENLDEARCDRGLASP